MKFPGFVRSNARAGGAFGAIALGAAAVTALEGSVPVETLTALRSFIPGETQIFQLLLFGWIGVALGRFTLGAGSSPVPRGATAARRETVVKEEKVDRILRQIAKVLQKHLTDSESFSERLDGASERLSQQPEKRRRVAGPRPQFRGAEGAPWPVRPRRQGASAARTDAERRLERRTP